MSFLQVHKELKALTLHHFLPTVSTEVQRINHSRMTCSWVSTFLWVLMARSWIMWPEAVRPYQNWGQWSIYCAVGIFCMKLQGVKFFKLKNLLSCVKIYLVCKCQCTATCVTVKLKVKDGLWCWFKYLNDKPHIDTVDISIVLLVSVIVVSYHPLLLSYTTLTPHSNSKKIPSYVTSHVRYTYTVVSQKSAH